MSHEHTVIEPAAGLTVLIGPNNIGKSAVIVALQILCTNETSTYVKRHGTKECSVTVSTDDGHTVQWRRKTSPSYVIDGQVFDRLQRSGLPDELHQALRLPKVKADEEGRLLFDVHFGSQKSPIFLLDQPGSAAASFFASSSDASRLVEMQRLHRENLRDAKKQRQELEQKSQFVNKQLAALDPIETLEQELGSVDLAYQQLQELGQKVNQLSQSCRAIDHQQKVLNEFESRVDVLQQLSPLPEFLPAELLEQRAIALQEGSRRCELEQRRHAELEELTPPPELMPVERLDGLLGALRQIQTLFSDESVRTATLDQLQEPPALADIETLETLVTQLQTKGRDQARYLGQVQLLQDVQSLSVDDEQPLHRLIEQLVESTGRVEQAQKSLKTLALVTDIPQEASTTELERIVRQLQESSEGVEKYSDSLIAAEWELGGVAEEIRSLADQSRCPTCGAELNADRLLEHLGGKH